jgi:CO/xanthine dehydrogenase Mo-binding subunit/aerobic-type carbon monoxide dehydrogenase small subunit (CoxS/CutS family)
MPSRLVGQSVLRKEGRAKVTGQALYVDDVTLPGMLHGVTVRSPSPRGRIRGIHFGDGIPWDEFTVVTAADVPEPNRVVLIMDDQPCLADGIVNHAEEPVVLLAHADKLLIEKARRAVTIDIDPLPSVHTIDDALEGGTIVWGKDNIFKSFLVTRGDVDAIWSTAHLDLEGEYETGAQEQLYIEPQGVIAESSPDGGITVRGSLQCPYYVHKALVTLFGLPGGKVRVVQMETGGGFGGKEEYPSLIAAHAALLARKAGRPVKLVYDRAEDMVATTKRHPSRTRVRTAVDRDGRLLALDVDFVIDGGAYCTLSPVVLSRGTIHAAGPYNWPNVRVRARAVATSTPPHGAFRGFGAPQSLFALERHMDVVAAALALPPDEFRRRNFIRQGQTSAVGQVMREPVDMDLLLDRALGLSDYHAKAKRFAEQNPDNGVKKGIGFATFMHGAGFTGSGEEHLASVVDVEVTAKGRVRVLAASTEIGQGTNTIFSQLAADALGVDLDDVDIVQPDTAAVPDSGPTVASRTCMVVGRLVETAAKSVKAGLIEKGFLREPYTPAAFKDACGRYLDKTGPLRRSSRYEPPPGIRWDDTAYQGDAYGTYAWAAYVAEVSVDMATCETRVDDFVAVQEVGTVIHPVLATGQIEGGVAQAIGYALYEDVVWRDGRMANAQMTNYIMPTSMDLPPIRVFFEERPYAHGAAGAKGIGELPMDGVAPAIANAIAQATGVNVTRIPVTPEVLIGAIRPSPSASGSADSSVVQKPPAARDVAIQDLTPVTINLRVNGRDVAVRTHPMARLLDVLRQQLNLTGTKEGCGEGECGACSVLIDGELVNSCLLPVLQADGASIVTIEGLSPDASELHALQQSFLTHGGAQCGICTPGMVLAASSLLERCPNPTDADIRMGLAGNLCRCTGYMRIFEAVRQARQQPGGVVR